MTTSTEYIADLRTLANLLESKPDLLPPSSTMNIDGDLKIAWNVWGTKPAARIAELIKLIGGTWDKNEPTDGYDGTYYILSQPLGHHVSLQVCAYRERVCERVVTGTRKVEQQIPTAHETVTVTEDVVEWRCHPLLAEPTA